MIEYKAVAMDLDDTLLTSDLQALCPAMLQQMEKPEAPCWVTSPGAAAWMVLPCLWP